MNIDIIPKGKNCYDHNGTCSYYTSKKIEGICILWCNYLNEGGVDRNIDEDDIKILNEHFGTDGTIEINLPLSGLSSQCKECNENL